MGASGVAALRPLLLSFAIGALAGLPLGAQNTPAKDKDSSKSTAIKLPSGAIIVVAGNPDAIDKPDAVYLSPEKFKELNDQIEQLKKQVAAEKAMPANYCKLEGRVEQRGSHSIARLKATFQFQTWAPRSVVFLGCKKAQPVEAKLEDGKLPLLAATDKGLTVQVESAGPHSVQLVLDVPVLPRDAKGNEIGFELGLPSAAVTLLTFEAPAKVKRLTVATRKQASASAPASGVEPPLEIQRFDAEQLLPRPNNETPLGAISSLAVSWEGLGRPGVVENTRSADADVQVTIGETDIQAEARLRLRGTATSWRFLAPSNADVTVGRAPPLGSAPKPLDFPVDQAPDVLRPEQGKSEWQIKFREANATELLVLIGTRTPRNRNPDPKSRTLWPAGPFAALDVPQQSGTIRVKSLPTLRAVANLKADTQRVDTSEDPAADAIYRYRSLPPGPNNLPGAPMDLDIRTSPGAVQTRVRHFLSLGEGGWRLRSEILVTPVRSEIESLDLEVPAGGSFEASTPRLVEAIALIRDNGPRGRVIQVKLASPQRGEFSLTLEGSYPVDAASQHASLVLPRLLNVFNRSDQVTVTVPEGMDLSGGAYQMENDKPGTRIHPLEPPAVAERPPILGASVSRTMSHVDLFWKPHRSDIRVEAIVDVRLGDRQGLVTQQLHYTFADQPQRKLRLRAPASVERASVSPGTIDDWLVTLPADPGKEASIKLNFSFPIPAPVGDEPTRISVPLIWPSGVTASEYRVRVLRDRAALNHRLPTAETDAWQELPVEVVPDESALPLLVLRASGMNLPLNLTLRDPEASGPLLPAIWIDRALIQAQFGDVGQQYRARFHLSKWQSRGLDLELPAGAADIELRANGQRQDVRDALATTASGITVHIPLTAWREQQHQIVELDYRLPGINGESLDGWISRWQPPRPRGRVAIGAVRWQVAIAQRSAPLSVGDAEFEERWAFRNGLVHPVPAYSTAELEKWLLQNQEPEESKTPRLFKWNAASNWEMSDAGVTALQSGLGTLRIVAIPRMLWLFAVSLLVLLGGLLLSRVPRRSAGVLVAGISAAVLVAGVIWPQPTGQALAAAIPGLLIVVLVLVLQRFLHWRYRRRLARMPGFTRVHMGSSLVRVNGKTSTREAQRAESPAES